MELSDDGPRSLPCSAEEAKFGIPVIVQLHLVDAGLKENALPREDFYRQYSVTPERQTPEEERTPPPPSYSPETILGKDKAWAATVAKSLKRFHAGRVMLRREEAEDCGVSREDFDYWSSKAKDWQGELWRLMKEMGKRKKLELKGEAEEGYALAMLASPLQSPSPPRSDSNLSEVGRYPKSTTAIIDELPGVGMHPLHPHAEQSSRPSQLTSEHNPAYLPTPIKGQKRTHAEVEDQDERSLGQISCTKRQRREAATSEQEQKLVPNTKSTPGTEKTVSRTPKPEAKQILKRKIMPPKAPLIQRTIPWNLRSRGAVARSETGMGTETEPRSRQGKKKAYERAPRLHGEIDHG